MKKLFFRIVRLFSGLILYAVGIVMTINANLGLAPWDVFHQGISKTIHITIGQAGIWIGFALVIFNTFFQERLGWGTIGNMLFIGIFIDLLMFNNLIPQFDSFVPSLIMLILGLFIIGIASIFYIGAGFGSGPRDGLMVVLTKKTGKSIRFIRNAIEIVVLIIGYLLGGFVGIGTLISALLIGYVVQLVFNLFNFDVSDIKHRYIDDDIKLIRQLFSKYNKYLTSEYGKLFK